MSKHSAPLHLGWFAFFEIALGPLVALLAVTMMFDEPFRPVSAIMSGLYFIGSVLTVPLCGLMWLERRYFGRITFWLTLAFATIVLPLLYLMFFFVFGYFTGNDQMRFDKQLLENVVLQICYPYGVACLVSWGGARLLQRLMLKSKAVA